MLSSRIQKATEKAEAANKAILNVLKKKIEGKRGSWDEKVHGVLWSYRKTHKKATDETLFCMAYGAEPVTPLEVQMSSLWLELFDEEKNNQGLILCSEVQDEVHDISLARMITQKQGIARCYIAKAKQGLFDVGDFVLRKMEFSTANGKEGKLGANWKGPFKMIEVITPGTYRLEDLQGKRLPHPWNVQYLSKYYQQIASLLFVEQSLYCTMSMLLLQ